MKLPRVFLPTFVRLGFLPASLFLIILTVRHAEGAIIISGDFLSGPTGGPITSTDPAFWTGGGDPDSDPATDPNTDGIIGVTSDGLLTISGGSDLNLIHLDLGQNLGVTGTVEVTGAGSTLNLGNHFHIGAHADAASTLDGGNGSLTITDGGVVHVVSDIWLGDSAASTGTALVDGVGSILRTDDDLWLGDDGVGSLTVRNGGLVEVADTADVGDEPGGSGILIVDGANSVFRTRDIDFGDDGHGQGTVTNGARLEASDDIQIANDVGGDLSSLTVQGANTIVTATDQIRVGDEARGALNVSDAARIEAGDIVVGGNETGVGTMIIEGTGTTVIVDAGGEPGDFISGGSGQGNTTIRDGARLEAGVVRIGDGETSEGVINVQGANSTIVSSDTYLIGFGGSGSLVVSGGARAEAQGDIFLGLEPGVVGHVTVRGTGSTLESINAGIDLGNLGGNGRLSVLEGAQVTALADVGIGSGTGSNSWATVSGGGSQLSSDSITVGGNGKGVLNVFDGGQATASDAIAIGESASGGTVNVRGAGSSVSAASLDLGTAGPGRFNLSESGSASFEIVEVSATGTVNMVVSSDNMLASTNSYTNEGATNFIAGSQLASGSYTPISSPSYAGAGSYVGIGGTTSFPSGVPTFTVGAIITDAGDGTESMIDGGDRVQFGNVTISLNENAGVTGSLAVTDLSLLNVLENEALLAFSFEASGLDTGLLTALSFDVGQHDRNALRIFQRVTGAGDDAWVAYKPMITDYTNGAFTFTVNELSGFDFAVVIPEPSSLTLLGLGGLCVAWRRR